MSLAVAVAAAAVAAVAGAAAAVAAAAGEITTAFTAYHAYLVQHILLSPLVSPLTVVTAAAAHRCSQEW